MKYVNIGQVVNTHGLKGEVRLLSDFEYKDLILKPGSKVYIGKKKEELVIKTYRRHKEYDMLTFEGLTDINDVIIYKGEKAFINRDDISKDILLDSDLVGLDVYTADRKIGTVKTIMKNKAHPILVVENSLKNHLIPDVPEFVKQIDMENKKIIINGMEGLIDED